MLTFLIDLFAYRWKLVLAAVMGGALAMLWAFSQPLVYRYKTVAEFPILQPSMAVKETARHQQTEITLPRLVEKYRLAVRNRVYERSRTELKLGPDAADTTITLPENGSLVTFISIGTAQDADAFKVKHTWFGDLMLPDLQALVARRKLVLEQGQANAAALLKQEASSAAAIEADFARVKADRADTVQQLTRRRELLVERIRRLEAEEGDVAGQLENLGTGLGPLRALRLANRNGEITTPQAEAEVQRLRHRQAVELPAEREAVKQELASLDVTRVELDRQELMLRARARAELTAIEARINQHRAGAALMLLEAQSAEPLRLVVPFERAFEPEPRFILVKAILGAVATLLGAALALLLSSVFAARAAAGSGQGRTERA